MCGREGKHLREPRMVFEKKTSKEDPNPQLKLAPLLCDSALRIAIALRRGDFHLEVGGEKKRVWTLEGDKGVDKSQRLRSSSNVERGNVFPPNPSGEENQNV